MSNLKNLTLSHFLSYKLWVEAKRLLDFQIAQKATNRYFNTLNFYYFDKVKNKVKRIGGKTFFKEKINNNMFYGLEKEMFFYRYAIPKQGIGLRRYFFFSYPMAVLQYAIGLYLLKITSQFIKDNKRKNVESYYGGNLQFDVSNRNRLVFTKKTIFYREYYNSFKRALRAEANTTNNKVIVRLDVQNYFDNISISKLLKLINENVKPSELKISNYNTSTKELIEFFYRFLNDGRDILPQGDNNIISGYLSYLYLVFGDLIIEDLIKELDKKSNNILSGFKIIRYVDDIYISLNFQRFVNGVEDYDYNEGDRNRFIYQLLNNIADGFYRELHLRFNKKVKIFRIENPDEKNDLLEVIKKVSEYYAEPDDSSLNPPEKFEKIVNVLREIATNDIAKIYKDPQKSLLDTLKSIYDEKVSDFIDSNPQNIQSLERIFDGFNFDLLRIQPQSLIALLTKAPTAKQNFEQFLLEKQILTTFDRGLIINYLCQTGFTNRGLVKKLKEDIQLKPIIGRFSDKSVIDNNNTGYYNVNFLSFRGLLKEISLIEQIRMRVYAEKTGQFSVSLNHLLNEIQLICCLLEGGNIKNYNVLKVISFLDAKSVPNTIKTKIRNLFDRRNNNPVAHPGSDTRVAWSVSEVEYFGYKESVKAVLDRVI